MAIWLYFRLDFGPTSAIGPHKAAMLEAIDRFGSISKAAPAINLTFRQLWRVVQSLNVHFSKPLIEIRRSGRSSGAFLTPLGKEVLTRYREMERLTNRTLQKHFRAFETAVGIDHNSPQLIPRFAQVIDPALVEKTTRQKTVARARNKKMKAEKLVRRESEKRDSANRKRPTRSKL